MVSVSASVNLPLHHKVQKFSSGTGSPSWSRKKGRKTVVVWCDVVCPDGNCPVLCIPCHTNFLSVWYHKLSNIFQKSITQIILQQLQSKWVQASDSQQHTGSNISSLGSHIVDEGRRRYNDSQVGVRHLHSSASKSSCLVQIHLKMDIKLMSCVCVHLNHRQSLSEKNYCSHKRQLASMN